MLVRWQKLLLSVRMSVPFFLAIETDCPVYTEAKLFAGRQRGFNGISESKEGKRSKGR